MVSNSMDEMSVTSVLEDLEEEYRAAMLHDNMDLGRLVVHAHQVEESRRKKRGREGKKPKTSDQAACSSGRSLFGVLDKSKFQRGTSTQVILLLPGNRMPKWTSLAPKRAMIEMPGIATSRVGKCGRLHGGECLVGTNICYGCG